MIFPLGPRAPGLLRVGAGRRRAGGRAGSPAAGPRQAGPPQACGFAAHGMAWAWLGLLSQLNVKSSCTMAVLVGLSGPRCRPQPRPLGSWLRGLGDICNPPPYKPSECLGLPGDTVKCLPSSSPSLKPVIKQSPWCDYALLTRLGLELLPSVK